jgi:hypothetical protein
MICGNKAKEAVEHRRLMQLAGAFVQNAGFNDSAAIDHFSDTAVKDGDPRNR